MTTTAIRQFITLCGGPALDKGAVYVEPMRNETVPVARYIGQHDYLAWAMRPGTFGGLVNCLCPFPLGTPAAACWSLGKFYERKHESAAIEAYHAEERRLA